MQYYAATVAEAAETGIGLWIRQHLDCGGVMIDVGANVGAFTELAADVVGPTGRIIAFEPGLDNAERLRERFSVVPQVTIVQAAVSDRSGSANFFLDRRNTTRHSLSASNVGKSGATVQVVSVTLDEYIPQLRRVDVVKIDAQGTDLRVLRGARRLLTAFRPTLIVEFWPSGLRNMGDDPAALVEELKASAYDVYRLSAKGGLKAEQRISDFLSKAGRWSCINLVAYPRESRTGRGAAIEGEHGMATARHTTSHWLRKLSRQILRLPRR